MSIRNIFSVGLVVVGLMIAGWNWKNENYIDEDKLYAGVEFEMPKVKLPEFPAYSKNIEDFGAVNDGLTDNTTAIQNAIQEVSENGGGQVIVSSGIWKTGPIELKSNINLVVEEGALLVFTDDLERYPLIETSFEGLNTYRCVSPISAYQAENIAITGRGIIDGSGDAWRPVKKSKMVPGHWDALVESGGVVSEDGKTWYPSKKSRSGAVTGNFNVPDFKTREEFEAVKDFLRPVMVSIRECKKVLLDGPTFQNSPAWNIHPLMCEDLTVRNTTVRNPWYSQNGDGIDVESCRNVVVYNNNFDVGDDAICIKSGKDKDGRDRGMPTENMIIKNNVVYHGHGGVTVGSEMSGGVRNIHVSDCIFIGTDIGLRFKSTRGRGGVVENVYISKVIMREIGGEAIRFNMFYQGESPISSDGTISEKTMKEEQISVTEGTPIFRNIKMDEITVDGAGAAAFMQGLPEMKLEGVSLSNSVLKSDIGVIIIDAKDLVFNSVNIAQGEGSACRIYNGSNILFDDFQYNVVEGKVFEVFGDESANIKIVNSDLEQSHLFKGQKVNKKSVMFKL